MRIVILDDEKDAVTLLQLKLKTNFPNLDSITIYNSPTEAQEQLQLHPPDLLFLDIEMPGMNGFDFLNSLMPISFPVIFVTAYNQYALKAFKYNALDYLTKPFSDEDLILAVNKAIKQHALLQAQLTGAQKQITEKIQDKIAIPTQNGISFIELNDIMYAESSNNYSIIYLKGDRQFTVSKTLKDLQDVLEETHFMRIHRQFIINLHQVRQFNKSESELVMQNGMNIPIARTMKEKLLELFRGL